ncbi:S26 family signal peptidase [Solirhodobacter olei]|uniref:S26 family signal peptidase n=1 Tax=Solirhodobacter olei TaxID=2493082 RepID=UPI0013E3FD06|nr:S26 family signal peptidase [Solirhodobacter olei]
MASRLALGLGGAIFALALALGLAGWRFNLTPSVRGLIFRPITAQIAVGRYVAFCLPWTSAELPESSHTDVPVCTADHPNRVKLIKRVGFIEPDGRLYVEGSNPRSYDSRYYGPIPRSAVTTVMARVW